MSWTNLPISFGEDEPVDDTGQNISSLLQTGILAASLLGRGRGKAPGKPRSAPKAPPKPPRKRPPTTTGRIATKAAREIQNLPIVKLGTKKPAFMAAGKIKKPPRPEKRPDTQGPFGALKTSAKLQKREREIAGELGPVSAARASAKLARKEAKLAGVSTLENQLKAAAQSAKVQAKATAQGIGQSLQRAKDQAIVTVKATSQQLGTKAQEGIEKIKQVGTAIDKQVQQMKTIATSAQQRAASALQDARQLVAQSSGLRRVDSAATLAAPASLKRSASAATLVNQPSFGDQVRELKRLKRDTEIRAIEKLADARRAVNKQIDSVKKIAQKKVATVSGQAGKTVQKAKNDLIVAKRDAELKVIDNLTQTRRSLDQKIQTVSKNLAKAVDKKLDTVKEAGKFVGDVFSTTNPSARRSIREAMGIEGRGTFRGVLDKNIAKDLKAKKKEQERFLAKLTGGKAKKSMLSPKNLERQLQKQSEDLEKAISNWRVKSKSRAERKKLEKKGELSNPKFKSVTSLDDRLRPADSRTNLAKPAKLSKRKSESLSNLPNFKNPKIKRSKSMSSLK